MAITAIRIHPAIGFARVGNAPDDFFLGPERRFDPPAPSGGFKDDQCRVKRQGARFRIYAYHDDDTVDEITAAEADITWTVHLANKKAAVNNRNPGGSASDLTIDPGARTVTGPLQKASFDTGSISFPDGTSASVPLGELRTDDQGRLVVLGGKGDARTTVPDPSSNPIESFYDNHSWYDDTSDGPVTATIKLHSTGDTYSAVPAWVIVGPPKFAPQLDSVVTLWDVAFDLAVRQGWLTAPATPSYTDDIYPILHAATTTRWVTKIGAHAWPQPVVDDGQRAAIFSRLRNPLGGGSNMPALSGAPSVTETQFLMLEKWKDGTFASDWAGPPTPGPITPAALDRAALEACVGAAFYPGIEAGGITQNPFTDPASYLGTAEPLRIDPAVRGPGDMTAYMALPWQADFAACDDTWWPVPRPNWVIPEGSAVPQDWNRGVGSGTEMADRWHTLGFVVEQGSSYVEVDRCDAVLSLNLLTPHLQFTDVPQGPAGMPGWAARAIVLEVSSTAGPVTLDYQTPPSNPRFHTLSLSATVGPTTATGIAQAKLWIAYETGVLGEVLSDSVVVRHAASGRTWTITLGANTVARKVSATALVLDRSGSMAEDRGDGQSKHRSLQQAAAAFVDLALPGDGIAVVRYDHDAQLLQEVKELDASNNPFGTRAKLQDLLAGNALDPAGATSIGDGIYEGRAALDAATGTFDHKAMVVLTDGNENNPRYVSEVTDRIDARTFAVGLGQPQNTSAATLQALAGNNGGYLLVTGAITGNNRFVLQKYFLQILAGINRSEVILDPDGDLVPGAVHEIPFRLTEADGGIEVIVLTPYPQRLDFCVRTPNGMLIEPWRAQLDPTVTWVQSAGLSFYRIALPIAIAPGRFEQDGTWHAVLRIGKPRVEPPAPREHERYDGELGSSPERRARALAMMGMRAAAAPSPAVAAIHPAVRVRSEGEHALASANGRLRTMPYSVVVHSYSRLSLTAATRQTGRSPGATITVSAAVRECDVVPVDASIWVEVTRPDGSSMRQDLQSQGSDDPQASFVAALPGVYQCRVRARGTSGYGHTFEREKTLTAVVWVGGDLDAQRPPASGAEGLGLDPTTCALLACVLGPKGALSPELVERLARAGLDLARLRRCLATMCRREPTPGERESTVSPRLATPSGDGGGDDEECCGDR